MSNIHHLDSRSLQDRVSSASSWSDASDLLCDVLERGTESERREARSLIKAAMVLLDVSGTPGPVRNGVYTGVLR